MKHSTLCFMSSQGRHVKTGQLAAIKVMDVTEVSFHLMLVQIDISVTNTVNTVEKIHHHVK